MCGPAGQTYCFLVTVNVYGQVLSLDGNSKVILNFEIEGTSRTLSLWMLPLLPSSFGNIFILVVKRSFLLKKKKCK